VTPTDVVDALRRAGATVATAESLTGGLVVAGLVDVAGASEVVRGGLVAYAPDVKTGVLGVPADIVAEHGTVAEATARSMAERVRVLCEATYGVATTGVAGPEPSEGKPAGTVHIAVAGPTGTSHRLLSLVGDRQRIRTATVVEALDLLVARLREESDVDLR